MTLAQLLAKLQKATPTERESVVRVVTNAEPTAAVTPQGRTLIMLTTKPVIMCQPGEKETLLTLGVDEKTSTEENLLTGDDRRDL